MEEEEEGKVNTRKFQANFKLFAIKFFLTSLFFIKIKFKIANCFTREKERKIDQKVFEDTEFR